MWEWWDENVYNQKINKNNNNNNINDVCSVLSLSA